MTWRSEYRNQHRELVAEATTSMIARPHDSANPREQTQNCPKIAGKGHFVSARERTRCTTRTSTAGDAIPVLTVTVDETQLFFFSAATYNGHRIHYDKEWARDREGYDDVLVQGPLQAALLSRALTDWIGGDGRLVAFSVQNRAVAHPGQALSFGGVVTEKRGDGHVDLDIFCKRGDDVLMPGTATVALPQRDSS